MRQQCSISTLVNRMSRMHLVSREKAAREKRQSIVITDTGQSLYRDVPIASLGMAFAALTTNQKQELAALLDALLEKARDLLGISHKLPFLKN
jgi:DNA-binding MarR family transcriptional regulator